MDFDWHIDRVIADHYILIKHVKTRDQLTEILTQGSFSALQQQSLLQLWNVSVIRSTSLKTLSCIASVVLQVKAPMMSEADRTNEECELYFSMLLESCCVLSDWLVRLRTALSSPIRKRTEQAGAHRCNHPKDDSRFVHLSFSNNLGASRAGRSTSCKSKKFGRKSVRLTKSCPSVMKQKFTPSHFVFLYEERANADANGKFQSMSVHAHGESCQLLCAAAYSLENSGGNVRITWWARGQVLSHKRCSSVILICNCSRVNCSPPMGLLKTLMPSGCHASGRS